MIRDDGAVSETLGYILLFGIALTAIAIILLVGNTAISQEKSRDNFQNMEQCFTIIQSDLNQLALDGTPVKTTRVHMEDGTFGFYQDTTKIQVNYNGNTYSTDTGQIVFTQGNNLMNTISIENGGVWKAADDYTFIIDQPRMYITPQTKTLVVNVYKMTADSSPMVNAGVGTMNIEMRSTGTNVLPPDATADGTAVVRVDTKYPEAWKKYFNSMAENIGGVTVSFTPYVNGVEANFAHIDHLMVSEHRIKIALSGIVA